MSLQPSILGIALAHARTVDSAVSIAVHTGLNFGSFTRTSGINPETMAARQPKVFANPIKEGFQGESARLNQLVLNGTKGAAKEGNSQTGKIAPGKALLALGIGLSVANAVSAPPSQRGRIAVKETTTWVGIIQGAGVGAPAGPIGIIVGGLLGGLIGRGAGEILGSIELPENAAKDWPRESRTMRPLEWR